MPRRQMGRPVVIDELDIPIFFIRRLGDRQFLVGGGGGSSKTGVPNAVVSPLGSCPVRNSNLCSAGKWNIVLKT